MAKTVKAVQSTTDLDVGPLQVQEANQVEKTTQKLNETAESEAVEVETKLLDLKGSVVADKIMEDLDEMVLVGYTVDCRSETLDIEEEGVIENNHDDEAGDIVLVGKTVESRSEAVAIVKEVMEPNKRGEINDVVVVRETVESESETVVIEQSMEVSSEHKVESPKAWPITHPSPAIKSGTIYIEGRLRGDSPKTASTQACKV